MPDAPAGQCPHCSDNLIPGKLYCANCGQPVVVADQKAAIDAYIAAKVAQEVALKTQNEPAMVRDIAYKAETELRKRFQLYSWIVVAFVALGTAFAAWFGVSTLNDTSRKIVDEAKGRVEPVVKDVERRGQAAQDQIRLVEKRIPEITTSLNATSTLADTQRKRIDGQATEIASKLKTFDAAVGRATQMGAEFEARVSSTQKRFDDATKRYDTQLTQVTALATHSAVSDAFPTLDQEPFISISNSKSNVRLDQLEKRSGDKWVNIYLTYPATAKALMSGQRIEEMVSEVRAAGFTPLLGRIVIGGRISNVLDRAGQGSYEESAVLYFNPGFKTSADQLYAIASKYTSFQGGHSELVDVGKADPGLRAMLSVVIKDRKLDAQIFLSSTQ